MDYHAFLKSAVGALPTSRNIQKISKEKKELKGIHGLLTDFFIFPGQFFTTNMEYGVWGAANFEKLTFSEILEENHCTTNNTMQIKMRQFKQRFRGIHVSIVIC